MYIPDRVVERRLKDYDSKLSVKWLPNKERWGIFRQVKRMNNLYEVPMLIKVLQYPDESFKPLDTRILDELKRTDMHIRGRRVLDEMEEEQKASQSSTRRAERNEAMDMADDLTPRGGFVDPEMGAVNVPQEDLPIQEETPYEEGEI